MQIPFKFNLSQSSSSSSLFFVLLLFCCHGANGFGTMGPISASFGEYEVFCSIDASGKQDVICWGKNTTSPQPISSSSYVTNIPAMSALSGGEGFLCGILANTSQAFCWAATSKQNADPVLVPAVYKNTAYSRIAAGKNHVCAVRGSYYSDRDSGTVDCWQILKRGKNGTLTAVLNGLFFDQSVVNLEMNSVVSGEGFTCGGVRDGGLVCWGPNSTSLKVSNVTDSFSALAAGRTALCGVSNITGDVRCWGDIEPPTTTEVCFVSLSGGARHFCGVREDNHVVQCWGNLSSSLVPKGYGFMAIASSDYTTCGIREDDLLLDCWLVNASKADFDPPLELSSPGLCRSSSCGVNEFDFNVSVLSEPDLTSLCVRQGLRICSPCGYNCSQGYFLSSPCTRNSDRVCTACSLCQNSSCLSVCRLHSSNGFFHWHHIRTWVLIVGSSALCLLLILVCVCFFRCCACSRGQRHGKHSKSCIGKHEQEDNDDVIGNGNGNGHLHSFPSASSCPGLPQVFRLSELKDATNGFKEFNELGRGSHGFVYKANLADGRVVAVKRANAATIIHTNNRDFEMELELLCKIRHCNVVNLLGYCAEMGERLLVYEYMSHGTLSDHIHGGLSPLNWSLRLKIAMQSAKGVEYLHKELSPPIVHKDLKSSSILLDSEWGARVSDFGLVISSDKDLNADLESDVYSFGIVLLEILSGRKAHDIDFDPPNVVEWAVPLFKQGKAAAIIDRSVALPRNVEPLLKLGDIAELAVRENPSERPSMSDIASWLEQIVRDGLIL
ncbi:serine/threonine-protein kinase-like protein CCR1 [Vicia villosa]|uniref:serine/threonine-protein kinase-like protein CCR1 n=1 Tax=Vicia villosa TaxID=3911 RepID=UPI00273CCF2E|nr:serine/threonine-protein kinase-like protein CCR1 [Vicia villosa]